MHRCLNTDFSFYRANGIILLLTTLLVIYFSMQNKLANRGMVIIEDLPSFRYAL